MVITSPRQRPRYFVLEMVARLNVSAKEGNVIARAQGSDDYVQPQMDCGIGRGGAVRPATNRLERPISDWKRQLCEAGGKRQYCWRAFGRKRHSCQRDG